MLRKCLSILLTVAVLLSVFSTLPLSVSAAVLGDDYPNRDSCAGCHSTANGDSHNDYNYRAFYYRQCTDFVAWRLNNSNGVYFTNSYGGNPSIKWGNANHWDDAARALGITVDGNPAIGAVAQTNAGSYGHVAWVADIIGNDVVIEEYNYNYACNYSKRQVSKGSFNYIHIKDIAQSDPTPDFTPADVGTDFYASIENTKSAKPIIVSGNNVVLGETSGENIQIWKFERQSDISYKIINVSTGTCLDDENYGTANESNIQVCASNDSTAQRWYLKVVGNGYSLVPKCALNSCIDIHNGDLSVGSNVQLFQQNATDAQIFSISLRPSFNAVNKGDVFTAAIIFNVTGSAVTAFDNNNVGVMSYTGNENQLWEFERKSNRSYKITNVATGKCLDDENYGTSDKTNIQVCASNNSTAQRWFLKPVSDGFSLAPQCALNGCIDSYDGGTKDGMNIYLWTQNSTAAQIVSLKYVLSPDYETTYNGHVYKLYNKALPWKEAYKFCEQQGGHLVTINSENEQSFLYSIIKEKSTNSYLWLGATDSYEEGKWKWVTGESIVYRNWANNEPNNYNDEDYMVLYKNSGKWNDGTDIYYSDTKSYSFICEYDNENVYCNLEKTFDYNDHRYEVYSNSVDWQTAKHFCEQKGGHLVTITSTDENNVIKNNVRDLSNDRYWLGLTDISLQSKWKWITDEPFSFKNWSNGEPNNTAGIETYSEFNASNGSWNDLRGFACISLNIGFICEYDTIPIIGDTNLDGKVDVRDVTAIQRHIAELDLLTDDQLALADTNGDGNIDISDATHLQMYLAEYDVVLGKQS